MKRTSKTNPNNEETIQHVWEEASHDSGEDPFESATRRREARRAEHRRRRKAAMHWRKILALSACCLVSLLFLM
ncbi:MAG TPA: hypothetical protein VF719_04655, partial [Abditibacteriaceae bacterium]